jgi:protoporphyrinogen oxidase
MVAKRVVIIGAGPAGLTAAYELSKLEIPSIVLEKGSIPGGIARTENYKGYRIDIGGHRFFTKVDEVRALWHEVLGPAFVKRSRLSRIYYDGKFFFYPLRPFNAVLGLGLLNSTLIVLSYLYSQLFPYPGEDTFEEWVSNRFGRRLYRIFFKTYTEKVWGIPCSELKAEWAVQRIRGLSLPSAVRNAILRPKGQAIKTLIEEFEYPFYGPGMLWTRVKEIIESRGSQVRLNTSVIRVRRDGQHVVSVAAAACTPCTRSTAEGGSATEGGSQEEEISEDQYISTMPLGELIASFDPPAPDDVRAAAECLAYRDFLTVALIINRAHTFPDNWIYIHSPGVKVGRIQNFKNWSPGMVPDPGKTCLGLEYFCAEGDELWRMSDEELIELGRREMEQIGLIRAAEVEDGVVFRQPRAYPVYTGDYKAHVGRIKAYITSFDNLQTIGRNGLHMYNNQDHSMLTAILAVKNILGENHDVWKVNIEKSYHEEG